MKQTIKPQISADIEALFKKMPKIEIIPLDRTSKSDKEKAKLLKKFMLSEWSMIEARIKEDILYKMQRCYLFGQHKWIGCGDKHRHICRNCGLKASTMYNPKFTGAIQVNWDKESH